MFKEFSFVSFLSYMDIDVFIAWDNLLMQEYGFECGILKFFFLIELFLFIAIDFMTLGSFIEYFY